MKRVVLVAVVAVALAVLAAGCANVPDSGPVQDVSGKRATPAAPARIKPADPAVNASPIQIVNGYFDAMMSSPQRTDIARKYLTASGSSRWHPSERTTIYTAPRFEITQSREHDQQIRMTYGVRGELSQRGRYNTASATEDGQTLSLTRVHGQWRIDNPPPGLMITGQFFEGYYQTLNLYYFDDGTSTLVADPIYVPDGDDMATSLMTSLLRGPENLLAGQAKSYLPEEMHLAAPVHIRADGVAVVRMRDGDPGMSARDRERLSVQVVWTLRQLPAVRAVRIVIDGEVLTVPGVDKNQPSTTWDQYGTAPKGRSTLFAMRDHKLVVVDDDQITPFSGAWGRRTSRVADFRLDPRLRRIAVVSPGRHEVSVSALAKQAPVPVISGAKDVAKPVWDNRGGLWVVDRTRAGSAITVIRGKSRYTMPLGTFAGMRVTAFDLSPSNARFVAIARPNGSPASAASVYVGVVRRDARSHDPIGLTDVRKLLLSTFDISDPKSVGWRSGTSVSVLASLNRQYPQAYIAGIDGSSVSGASLSHEALLPDVGAVGVMASGLVTVPVYVADRDGHLWLQNSDGRWHQLSKSVLLLPSFPG